jgi:L-arabinokinase
MLAAYVTGHGWGHLTRLCEVLREVRARAPGLPISLVGSVPGAIAGNAIDGPLELRPVACDTGVVQRDALALDLPATAAACRAFDARWDERVDEEASFLRARGARAVVGDVPPLAFAAAARAGIPGLALTNFSWDWIWRHLAARATPEDAAALVAAADRAARAYAESALLLSLPFAGDLSAFSRREEIGLVARRPRVSRGEARRRLGLDGRPAVLLSFGGAGAPALPRAALLADARHRWVFPEELPAARLEALGLHYPDVVGAADVVVTKPGYGIVTDAIGAGTRLVYTERGDFAEYDVMVRELPRYLPAVHVSNADLGAGRLAAPIAQALAQPLPPRPPLDGAARAAARILATMG